MEMTHPPESGDRAWRDAQLATLTGLLPHIGYTAPNAAELAARNFVEVGDGEYARRPPRHLFTDAFEDDGDADILRMYREVRCPTLIIRCTLSGAPAVLDTALDELVAHNPNVQVVRKPLTHLAPAWDALDEIVTTVEAFFAATAPSSNED